MPSRLQDYDVLGMIGSGSYGTCKKIRRKKDNKVSKLAPFEHCYRSLSGHCKCQTRGGIRSAPSSFFLYLSRLLSPKTENFFFQTCEAPQRQCEM